MLQEQEKQKADIVKTNAEASKLNVEAVHKKLDIAGQAFGFVRANPTLENANATLDYLGQQGIYTPEQVSQYKEQVSADPSKIALLAEQAFRSALAAKDQLSKIESHNIGGSTITQTVDPVTGKTTTVSSVKNTQSPDSVASVAATIRGQNMTDARARELNKITQEGQQTQIINDPVRGPILINKGTGVARPAVAANGSVVQGELPAKKEASAKNLIPVLDEADKLIDGATGSYLGYGVDQAARAFGKVTEGSKNTAQLKVLEGSLMMNQPRMEGPQSDKDVAMYRQMAGQIGDPTVPREIKKAALATIRKLNNKYAGIPDTPAGGNDKNADLHAQAEAILRGGK